MALLGNLRHQFQTSHQYTRPLVGFHRTRDLLPLLHEHAEGPIQRLVRNMPLVKPYHGTMSHHAPTEDSEKGQESDIIRCRNEWGGDLPELQHQGFHIPSLCLAAHLLELP